MAQKKQITLKPKAELEKNKAVNEKEETERKDIAKEETVMKEPINQAISKPAKKVFEQTERIRCLSVTQGGLFLDGPKTKQPYSFSDYDDETFIEYRDLVGLIMEKSSYIFHPFFIIDDKDFVEEFPQLKKFYDEYYDIRDLKSILELPIGFMLDKMRRLPSGALDNLKIIASSQVADGELDSVKKIKALSEFFEVDLNLIAELNET